MMDVRNTEVKVGDNIVIAVGLSGSSSSSARLRFGRVVSLKPFVVFWEDTDKISQPMSFYSRRVMVL